MKYYGGRALGLKSVARGAGGARPTRSPRRHQASTGMPRASRAMRRKTVCKMPRFW